MVLRGVSGPKGTCGLVYAFAELCVFTSYIKLSAMDSWTHRHTLRNSLLVYPNLQKFGMKKNSHLPYLSNVNVVHTIHIQAQWKVSLSELLLATHVHCAKKRYLNRRRFVHGRPRSSSRDNLRADSVERYVHPLQ